MSQILIIEDEAVIRTALRRLLERHGFQIAEAGSVEETEALDLNGFDLIISDLRLPGAAGTEIIQHADEVPVLIMTSYASVRSAVEAMKGAWLRRLCSCRARATSSLPVPDSPRISTVASVGATFSMRRQTSRIASQLPTIPFTG
ncbi:hypothetical protein QQ73_10260 [Candidatus Endoriftia persephone str. Guaymas]|nr:hypothetical protein [Candidatus Endoriftia persephone str. Guaymas]